MKKILAIICMCLLSILINENAISKSNCKANGNPGLSHFLNTETETEPVFSDLKPYDGFFLKI